MSQLLLKLLDVMRLRAGPQDMPAGWSVAIVFSLVYLGQGFIADQILNETDSAPRGLIAVSIQFVVTAILLSFRQMSSRLAQTLTALAGSGILFGFISIILVTQSVSGVAQPALELFWLGIFIWSLAVDGHIYRKTLSLSMSMGMLIAVAIFGLNFLVLEFLFTR
jgi:hypothetical protein